MSNWWGQPRPDDPEQPGTPDVAPVDEAEVATDELAEVEPEIDAGPSDAGPSEGGPAEGEPAEGEPEPLPLEPVVTTAGLPTMAQLDALSAELDEIDAALAAMDADPSLPGRAATTPG